MPCPIKTHSRIPLVKSPHRRTLDTSETLPLAGVDQVCDLGSWQRMSGSGVVGANCARDVALAGRRCPTCRAGDCISFILRSEHKALAVDYLAVLRDRHVDAGVALGTDQLDSLSPPCSMVSKRRPVPFMCGSCGRLSGGLATIDLEALAELDIGFVDDFLEQGLTLKQRQPPEVVTVEVKQIERDHHNLFGSPLELVLQQREVRGAVRCRDHHLAVDDRRASINVPGIGCDLSETIGPVVPAPREYLDGGVPKMDLDPVAVELDLVNPAFASGDLVD
jgi:hypothetical protein